jgi:hypothetical protein
MIVRGIDPGERIGWCDLATRDGDHPRYLNGGSFAATDHAELRNIWRVPGSVGATDVGLIAIEMPGSLHPAAFSPGKGGPARIVATVQGLLRAARVGQQIIDAATAAGVRVVEVDAAQARRELGIKIGGNRRGPACG